MAITIGRSYDANLNYIGNGAGQWTTVTPSGPSGVWQNGYSASTPATTSMLIYVSKEVGANDSNPGSSSSPVLTLAHGLSLLRNGSPDWLLLRKGDIWPNDYMKLNISGPNSNEPVVITSYTTAGVDNAHPRGTGTGARPLLDLTVGSTPSCGSTGRPGGSIYISDNICVIGIEVNGHQQAGQVCFSWDSYTMNFLLIEDCKATNAGDNGFAIRPLDTFGTNAANTPYPKLNNFVFRRNVATGFQSSGLEVGGCPGAIIEENIFNGAGSGVTNAFIHCIYVDSRQPNGTSVGTNPLSGGVPNAGILTNCNPIGGNILMNEADQAGSNFRSGGKIIDNLHMSYYAGMDIGYATDTSQQTIVANNVGLLGRGGGAGGGSSQGVTIGSASGTNPPTYNADIASSAAGLLFRNNIATNPEIAAQGTKFGIFHIPPCPWDYITITNCIGITYHAEYGAQPIGDESGGQPHNSFTNYNGQTWASYGGTAAWYTGSAPTGMLAGGNDKTIADYMTSKGLPSPSFPSFTNLVLAQSRDTPWNSDLTANAVNNYFRTQLGMTYYALAPSVTISPTTVPNGTVGIAYNGGVALNFTASGGTAPYTWTHSGTVPPGLTFNDAAATLSGTPTSAVGSPFTFTVNATDSAGTPVTGSQSYTVTITAPAITITPSSLPQGNVGTPYSQTIVASGGTAPYTYSIVSGSLPPGLGTFPNSTGIVSGTPTLNGTFPFTVRATDSVSTTQDQPYVLLISPTDVVLPSSPLGAICM